MKSGNFRDEVLSNKSQVRSLKFSWLRFSLVKWGSLSTMVLSPMLLHPLVICCSFRNVALGPDVNLTSFASPLPSTACCPLQLEAPSKGASSGTEPLTACTACGTTHVAPCGSEDSSCGLSRSSSFDELAQRYAAGVWCLCTYLCFCVGGWVRGIEA